MRKLAWLAVCATATFAFARDPQRAIAQFVHTSWTGKDGAPNNVGALAQIPDGYLWIGTTAGVFRSDGVRFTAFEPPPGEAFPATRVRGLLATRDGALWIVWATGAVSRFENGHLTSYSEHDGLPAAAALAVSDDGTMVAATVKYKLEGHDSDWRDAGAQRQAYYGGLAPKRYRFRVIAANESGVWNEAGASFDFSIAPAYYQTHWFQAVCGAAFLTLLWGLYRYRLHQIAREFNMRLEERVSERTRQARDLHDTLLQGFQGLMLRLQAIDESLPEGEIKDELERTLDRGDQVVAESRKAVHDLRLSTVVTNDLARAIRTMGDELSSEGSATFALLVEGETRELHPIVRDEIYRITREALRNAFSHARATHIEAEITYGEQLFRLRIRDDGEGVAPAMLEKGRPGHYGLPGMRERAGEIGAKLDIWSGAGTGTEIDLSIAGPIAYGKRPGRLRENAE